MGGKASSFQRLCTWWMIVTMENSTSSRKDGDAIWCHFCEKKTPTTWMVPVCDKNPDGLEGLEKDHGNVIDDVITCEDEYCNPRDMRYSEFLERNGPDAEPQALIAYCDVCSSIKPGVDYEIDGGDDHRDDHE